MVKMETLMLSSNYELQNSKLRSQTSNNKQNSSYKIQNTKLQNSSYKIQIQKFKKSNSNYKIQLQNYKLQKSNYKIQITKFKLQNSKYNSLVPNWRFVPLPFCERLKTNVRILKVFVFQLHPLVIDPNH